MKACRNERGVALLVALLVVAILTVVVVEFTHTVEVDGHLARNALGHTQATYLARSAVALAEMTLRLDSQEKTGSSPLRPPVETPADTWAQPFPPFPVGGGFGTVSYVILDENARFNLNALVRRSPETEALLRQQLFQGILEVAGLDPNLLFPVLDWLDPGDEADRESGAESEFYVEERRPPYAARNGPFRSLGELLLVKGFDEITWEQWTLLQSMLTVLPSQDLRINLNTAPDVLVTALFTALESGALANTVLTQREDRYFLSRGELQEFLRAYQVPPDATGMFDVRSDIFTIYARGAAGAVERTLSVTEEIRRQTFPPQFRFLRRGEEPPPVTLTSREPSTGIPAAFP